MNLALIAVLSIVSLCSVLFFTSRYRTAAYPAALKREQKR